MLYLFLSVRHKKSGAKSIIKRFAPDFLLLLRIKIRIFPVLFIV